MNSKLWTLLVMPFAMACGTDEVAPSKDEVREEAISGKSDGFDWCAELEWYGDGICDEFCVDPDPDCAGEDDCFIGGCSAHICSDEPGVITTCEAIPEAICFQDAACERQASGECGWTVTDEVAECLAMESPAAPGSCPDGTPVSGPSSFLPSADGKECAMPTLHCVTNDGGACPQLSPLPPDFCEDGTVVAGSSTFITSGDGMECELPSVHCVTNDGDACPQLLPLPPDFCEDGTVVAGPSRFVPSGDGMECELPSAHCLTNDLHSCPLL